jgi:hypothetical protein
MTMCTGGLLARLGGPIQHRARSADRRKSLSSTARTTGARPQRRHYLGVSLRRLRLEGIMESGFEELAISEKTQFAGKMSGEA